MIARVTRKGRLLFAVSAFVLLLPSFQMASAQTSLGDEFIVFVEGKNVLVPFFDGTTVKDPMNPANTVAQFSYGDYSAPGFRWENATGVDMTSMVAGGASLYLKLLVDPANAGGHACAPLHGDDCLSLTIFDGFNSTDDREGRLKWFIPDALRDGKWHDLAIPLPPSTAAALDSAKVGKNLDGSALATPLDPLAMNWEYVGGWSGYGWGGTAGSPHGTADPNWQEFEWNKVRGLAAHFDWSGGGGAMMMDDVYFGSSTTDLSSATGNPAAMAGVTVAASGAKNKVSWTHNPANGGYRVYADAAPITQARIDAKEVAIYAELAFNAADFSVEHDYELPHGSLKPFPLYYAVTTLSLFGLENTDVSASAGMVENADLAVQAYVVELDNAGANDVFNSLSDGKVSDNGFPSYTIPFMVDPSHWKSGDGGLVPATSADLSGMMKIGFNRQFNELYIYGEVHDDVLAFHPGGSPAAGGEAWGYDSVEFGWGSYDVRDAGGSVIGGVPHESFKRGATPDYQGRIAWLGDETALNPRNSATFITTGSADTGQGNATGGGTVFDVLKDGTGATIGYKFLTLIAFSDFIFAQSSSDATFVPPPTDGVKIIPFNIAINDGDNADAANPRDVQVQWSTKPNAGSAWWNTPAQWMSVAVVGSAVTSVAIEDDVLPGEFALKQNYPNPFNPSTSISFTLPQTEDVTLSVYNLLGQKVATLLSSQQMNVGTHSVQFDASSLASGMYLYRLEAGSSYTKTLSMMLLK